MQFNFSKEKWIIVVLNILCFGQGFFIFILAIFSLAILKSLFELKYGIVFVIVVVAFVVGVAMWDRKTNAFLEPGVRYTLNNTIIILLIRRMIKCT